MCAFRQHSDEPTTLEAEFFPEGTSKDGLAVKKSAGLIMSWNVSTGLPCC